MPGVWGPQAPHVSRRMVVCRAIYVALCSSALVPLLRVLVALLVLCPPNPAFMARRPVRAPRSGVARVRPALGSCRCWLPWGPSRPHTPGLYQAGWSGGCSEIRGRQAGAPDLRGPLPRFDFLSFAFSSPRPVTRGESLQVPSRNPNTDAALRPIPLFGRKYANDALQYINQQQSCCTFVSW